MPERSFTVWKEAKAPDLLPELESTRIVGRYVLRNQSGERAGRLYVESSPRSRSRREGRCTL